MSTHRSKAAGSARPATLRWPIVIALLILFVVGTVATLVVAFSMFGPKVATPPATPASAPHADAGAAVAVGQPSFVGAERCATCHAEATKAWQDSHHALAMQVANEKTVLGRFDGATFTQFGVTSTFSQRDGKYIVRTDGPDGKLADFEVRYVFGLTPLQQYLIELPGGHIQALDIAWDTRPAGQGGQRWYHLHPDDAVPAGDVLHWTGPALNWNYMCAECHSTNLEKRYDPESTRYATTWTDIDVACEACHGPGSRHVAWATPATGKPADDPTKGLVVQLRRGPWPWVFDEDKPTARRVPPRSDHAELDTCARCHARRDVIADPYLHGYPITATHQVSLLDEGLYEADGQQRDEVYEYGSFLQSKMYHAGVTCTDCHEPHSVRRVQPPDSLCAQCHKPGVFAVESHHHHKPDSPGASCVACHMPTRTYMGVDVRRDHSFRVPRPDLTMSIGVPNACQPCHADKPAAWAAEEVARWRGPGKPPPPHFGEAIHAGRIGAVDAEQRLVGVVRDATVPAMARATALSLLGAYLSPRSADAVIAAAGDRDPLVRGAAARLLPGIGTPEAIALSWRLLDDGDKSVRLQAEFAILEIPAQSFRPEDAPRLQRAVEELRASVLINQDRAEAQTTLGTLAATLGDLPLAIEHLHKALMLNPSFVPARIQLAEAYRQSNQESNVEPLLRDGLRLVPANPDLHHALGLALVRIGKRDEAIAELKAAAEAGSEREDLQYAYGVALNSVGQSKAAIEVLAKASAKRPGSRQLLIALATIARDAGERQQAIAAAKQLVALLPDDPGAKALLAEVEGGR